ncbi:MAG: type VI secretion system tip protein VgrG [Gemmataceae bacterium]|nr:type VI secretion system tip protein VgrG [Gemmataceae bacterium]
MQYTQDKRLLAVTTPLGKDVLLLSSFTGQEEMSRLFHFQLVMLSEKDSLAAKDIVGKEVGWTVGRADKEPRHFHGVVSRFSAGRMYGRTLREYRAEVVPWLWFLTRTADCRIFQNKTAPQIVEQIFKDLGFSAFKTDLKGTYVKRDYCVQYRETDFDFVSRLMEQEGMFYYFLHEKGKHTLIVADHKNAYKDCADKKVVHSPGTTLPGHVTVWDHQYEFRPGQYAQTDYNFETPSTSLMTTTKTVVKLPGNDKYEIYDYPGVYLKKADGDALTKVYMEEQEAAYDVVNAEGTSSTFSPGGKFTLDKHECTPEQGKEYVVTSVRHSARTTGYIAGDSEGEDYRNVFTCVPSAVTFRPARTTPRPVVQGPQTAAVVGPKGEEIYTDKYGRVKVQFHWDREGKKDENSSCWIRVSQGWAGKNWGAVFLPRIGQEVIVDFLEGDPDRPIITGRVYNAEQMPPYELPANQTQSVIKSRSSKGGGTADFNELRLEDKKGSEDIYFHAQKDFHRVVENDDDLKVGRDQTIEIKNHRTETVKEGNEKVTIEKGKREVFVDTGDDLHQVKKGKRTVVVDTGDDSHQIKTGNRSVVVDTGNDSHQIKKGNRAVQIDMGNDTLTIKMGNQTTKLNLGKSSTEAMQSIELKVGQSSIVVDQKGVTIKGMMITIEGQVQTQVKGLMTQVSGDAMLQLKGGIIMIG